MSPCPHGGSLLTPEKKCIKVGGSLVCDVRPDLMNVDATRPVDV